MSIQRLFDAWYGRLVASMRRRLGDGDDAEDVAQEAFVRLIGETPENPRAWLFTVAGRLATDRRRAAARRARLAQDWSFGEGEAVDAAIERAESVAGVRRVLAALTERERRLLLLHHDGLSYREIAEELGVSPASVGSLLTRAHRRFLQVYDGGVVRGSRSILP